MAHEEWYTRVANDIRSGVPDSTLMTRYKLSEADLADLIKILIQEGFITQEEVDKRKSQLKPLKTTTMALATMSGCAGLVLAMLVGSSQYLDFIILWVECSLVFFLVLWIFSRWLPTSHDTWRLFESLCVGVLIARMAHLYTYGLVVMTLVTAGCFGVLKYNYFKPRWVWVTIVILIVINGATRLEEIKHTKIADRIVQEMEIADPVLKMRNDLTKACIRSCYEEYDLSLNPATWNPFSRNLEWCLEGCGKRR